MSPIMIAIAVVGVLATGYYLWKNPTDKNLAELLLSVVQLANYAG